MDSRARAVVVAGVVRIDHSRIIYAGMCESRRDGVLRAMLGIKWKELWALGYTQKASTRTLESIASGATTAAAVRAEALAALGLMDPADI